MALPSSKKNGKMKRTPSEDLFRLIRALSKGEKRNFKLLAGLLASEKDKKYIELFDAIDKQEVYDEGKVLKIVKSLYGGQLAVGKHYLYRLILNSLVYYSNSPGSELNNLLEQVKILGEKDLYPQAAKLLRKGITAAREIEDFITHYAMLRMQVELLLRTQSEKHLADRIAEIEEEKSQVLAQLSNLDAYKKLSHSAFLLLQTRQVANGEVDKAAVNSMRDDPLMRDIGNAISVRAKVEYLSLHRKFCSYGSDLEGAIKYGSQLLSLLDDAPALKEECIRSYFAEVGNVCTYLFRLGRIEEAHVKMEEFRRFHTDYPQARVDFFQLYYVILLASCVHLGNPERGLEMESEIEQEWATVEGKVPKGHEMWLRYLLAYSHFMVGKPRAALIWINRLLVEPKSEVRIDIQCSARILNMLIHFELRNYMLIESEVLSTRRFLEKHDQFHEYEKQVLRCIKALAVAASSPESRSTMETWLPRLQQLDAATNISASRLLNVPEWMQSHLEGRTMAAIRRASIQQPIDSRVFVHG